LNVPPLVSAKVMKFASVSGIIVPGVSEKFRVPDTVPTPVAAVRLPVVPKIEVGEEKLALVVVTVGAPKTAMPPLAGLNDAALAALATSNANPATDINGYNFIR
jgi:hypothetical protein